jgi:hypothetical protein
LISIKSSAAKPGLNKAGRTREEIKPDSVGKLSFAKDMDMYGSGYIYEKNRLGGKIATCVVKTQKEDGDALRLINFCSTNVTLTTLQFSLKDNALCH